MFRFEDPAYLWLLLTVSVAVLLALLAYYRKRASLGEFGDRELVRLLMPDVSEYRPWVKFGLVLTALSLLIVMLARPQMGSKISQESRNGIETVIALDISNSMKAADVVPTRLDKSKLLVENLVDNFTDDKIGLVVFAGEAFLQLPVTNDYVSAKMFLQDISPSQITTQGTDIARAIRLAMSSFGQESNVGRAIILITDGEDHEGEAIMAAKEARNKGINVFILGVGGAKGVPIPTENGYMKDSSGQAILTSLNDGMCKEVAKAGNGKYIHVDNTSDAQEKLNSEIGKLQKGETQNVVYSEYDEQFQAFGILALLLLVVEVCILEARNPLLKNIRLFRRNRK